MICNLMVALSSEERFKVTTPVLMINDLVSTEQADGYGLTHSYYCMFENM
jgi:hypothetical protein